MAKFQNIQLYRTNVLLGGQMKYDIVLGNKAGDLFVENFNITPIAPKTPYNKYEKINLLNNEHGQNVKKYYEKISGNFYKDFLKPQLSYQFPTPSNYNGELYDNTYEMGYRRAQYQLYDKQFEFFCPIWLEHYDPMDGYVLKFNFKIYNDYDQSILLSTKTLSFDIKQLGEEYMHDKFINYFNTYVKKIGLDVGCNWCIDTIEKQTNITGLCVKCGEPQNITITNSESNIYNVLTSRERTMLEQNSLIINLFKNYSLISKQLFNFNFCFNFKDITDNFIYDEMKNNPIFISVDCEIEKDSISEQLQLKDFYSNHEYIKSHNFSPIEIKKDLNGDGILLKSGDTYNILDYLRDYNCIDLMNVNKMIQNKIHWVSSKSGEHFNFYSNFSDSNDSNIKQLHSLNIDTADVFSKSYKSGVNPYWMNTYLYNSLNELLLYGSNSITKNIVDIIKNPIKYKHLYSSFLCGDNCIKNIEYQNNTGINYHSMMILFNDVGQTVDLLNILQSGGNEEDDILCTKFEISDSNANESLERIICVKQLENDVYMIIFYKISNLSQIEQYVNKEILWNKFILNLNSTCDPKCEYIEVDKDGNEINVNSSQFLHFKSFLDIVKSAQSFNDDIKTLTLTNGLSFKKFHGTSLIDAEEIVYYKKPNIKKEIRRRIGKIKPYFTNSDDRFNYLYFKKKYDELSDMAKSYINSKYQPVFPSIGYHFVDKIEQKYKSHPTLCDDRFEYHWFNDNKAYDLIPEFNIESESYIENGIYKTIKEIVDEYISSYYQKKYKMNQYQLEKIIELYEYESDYKESYIKDNEQIYIYKIKIKLK